MPSLEDETRRPLGVDHAGVPTGAASSVAAMLAAGYMLSEMTRQFTTANPELAERWRNMIPAGRMGEPADLEALVVFLCSARSSYLMGQSIVIDGAYTAV
jgi:NAD(P)-dependent dehydrogenase (short-subunit alcohol dehydrogenase family)